MAYQRLFEKYTLLEKEIYDSIVKKMVKHQVEDVTFTKIEEFKIGAFLVDTVTGVKMEELSGGGIFLSMVGKDDQGNDDNFYNLNDESCSLLDKLQVLLILENRF